MASTLVPDAESQSENRALTVEEAARYCAIKTGTLRNRLSRGDGPRVQRIGRRVIIRIRDLEEWIAANQGQALVGNTPQGTGR